MSRICLSEANPYQENQALIAVRMSESDYKKMANVSNMLIVAKKVVTVLVKGRIITDSSMLDDDLIESKKKFVCSILRTFIKTKRMEKPGKSFRQKVLMLETVSCN